MNKRLHLSLIALIGSVVLFVVASFAWLAVTRYVNIGFINSSVSSISIDSTISVSTDEINYIETQAIDFRGAVPGDIKFYQVEIVNTQSFPIEVNVFLSGFFTVYSGPISDPNSLTLYEVIEFNSFLDDTEVIASDYLENILADQPSLADARISISDYFIIQPSETRTVYFSFRLDESVGNEYFYKGIAINNIFIQFDQSGVES